MHRNGLQCELHCFTKSVGMKHSIESVAMIVFHHKFFKFFMKFLNYWCYITMCPANRVYITNLWAGIDFNANHTIFRNQLKWSTVLRMLQWLSSIINLTNSLWNFLIIVLQYNHCKPLNTVLHFNCFRGQFDSLWSLFLLI